VLSSQCIAHLHAQDLLADVCDELRVLEEGGEAGIKFGSQFLGPAVVADVPVDMATNVTPEILVDVGALRSEEVVHVLDQLHELRVLKVLLLLGRTFWDGCKRAVPIVLNLIKYGLFRVCPVREFGRGSVGGCSGLAAGPRLIGVAGGGT